MTKIRCCPFCGSDQVDINRTNQDACWVSCNTCFAEAGTGVTRRQAIKMWNIRKGSYVDDKHLAHISNDGDKTFWEDERRILNRS